MPRTVVITQPTYLPWLGYFEQIARADVFVFLDCVQFERRSWQCRNRLKGGDGEPFWLSVPVAKQPRETIIREIRISDDQPEWRAKHLRSISLHLGGAPFFAEVFPRVEQWLLADLRLLADLNIAGIRMCCDLLELAPEFLRASDLAPAGTKAELLAGIARQLGGTHYYTAAGAREYMEAEGHWFADAGLAVEFQAWPHPEYPQPGHGFVPYLAALDALMNIGPAAVRTLLQPTLAARASHD